MKLFELFITEMTEEDRAIISLSTGLSDILKNVDIDQPFPIEVGVVNDLIDTPLTALHPVSIQLDSPENMGNHMGEWDDGVMKINTKYLQDIKLRRILTHELRHALDDYKSDFRANASHSYSTPKNPNYRKPSPEHPFKDMEYHAQPAEINARFVEVLDLVTRSVRKGVQSGLRDEALKSKVMDDFKRAMIGKHITQLFPEKEKSKDYKRLMSRAMDFIGKELQFANQSK